MLSRSFNRFAMREHEQATNLTKGLRGHHQREFKRPEREVRRLHRSRAGELGTHNPFARELWMREWGGGLCDEIGACGPRWKPDEPVYFLTLIDRQQIVRPRDPESFQRPNPSFRAIRRSYARALRGFDYVGMLDPALYVSTQWVERVPRFVLWHLHALVWNTSTAALDRWAEGARWSMRPYLKGASSVDIAKVRNGDLHQVIWYTAKMPRKQYQLWTREKGSLQQYKRQINGVNAVRLYAQMSELTLPNLTLAGGFGRPILQETIEASHSW